jgi:hypothetical protein
MSDKVTDITNLRKQQIKEQKAKEKAERPNIFKQLLGKVDERRMEELRELEKHDLETKGENFNPWLDR